jgi:hypothetical protein
VGCNQTATAPVAEAHEESHANDHDHDHDHDHEHEHEHAHESRPESFAAAVTQLVAHRDAIRTAIESGKPADAHDPLHEVAELLDSFPDIAAETDLSKEDWEAVKAATDRLFDSFGVVDESFHKKDGDKKAAYESVADDIEESMEAIESRLPLAGPADAASQGEAPSSDEATGR